MSQLRSTYLRDKHCSCDVEITMRWEAEHGGVRRFSCVPQGPCETNRSARNRSWGATVCCSLETLSGRHFERTSRKPVIYLCAGVNNTEFTESLELAAKAGTKFSGVLHGSAASRRSRTSLFAELDRAGVPSIFTEVLSPNVRFFNVENREHRYHARHKPPGTSHVVA